MKKRKFQTHVVENVKEGNDCTSTGFETDKRASFGWSADRKKTGIGD